MHRPHSHTLHDPLHTTIQMHDTSNITHAFLDHDGFKVALHIPFFSDYTITTNPTTPNTEHTRPIRFRFPIARPPLTQWAEEVKETIEQTASRVHTDLTNLLATLKIPSNGTMPPIPTTPEYIKLQILESADTIRDFLSEGLRIATNLFPSKAPFIRFTGNNRSRFWPRQSKETLSRSTIKPYYSDVWPGSSSKISIDKRMHITIRLLTLIQDPRALLQRPVLLYLEISLPLYYL